MNDTSTRRAQRAGARSSRARSRRRSGIIAALAVAGSVIVGVGAAGGTYAFLNAEATLPGATITAGSLDLTINGQPSVTLGTWAPTPAIPAVHAFTVTNVSTVPVTVGAAISVTATQPITAYTRASLLAVSDASACVAGLGTRQALAGYAAPNLGTLAAGATATYCLEIALEGTSDGSLSSQSQNFTLTLTATQRTTP